MFHIEVQYQSFKLSPKWSNLFKTFVELLTLLNIVNIRRTFIISIITFEVLTK